jgi:hypothetical protein
MIRKHLIGAGTPGEAEFRWRGEEVTRLEGFSDAVFAFTVTLLVVSLEVPKTFPQLIEVLHGFLPFSACFYLLAHVWRQHVLYFRRYGLQDTTATVLNCALLFFVLFYVYPMKFMFVKMFEQSVMEEGQIRTLFVVFAGGFGAISHNAMLLISLAGATLAEIVPASWVGRTGFFYFVIPVYYFISESIFGRQLRRLAKR